MPRYIVLAVLLLLTRFLSIEVYAADTPPPPPQHGIYIPAPLLHKDSIEKTFKMVLATRANTLVVDIKEGNGGVSIQNAWNVVDATPNPDYGIIDVPTLLKFSKVHNIRLVGRIVLFMDPCIAKKHPNWAIRNKNKTLYAEPGIGLCGPITFVSPYFDEIWDYNLELAKVAHDSGFQEIQLDYIRFPDQTDIQVVVPRGNKPVMSRVEVITKGLERFRQMLPAEIPISVDVFGRTVNKADDIIGQNINAMSKFVSSVNPMLYPTLWNSGEFGLESPKDKPYEIVQRSLASMKLFTAEVPHFPTVRPWYQTGEMEGKNYGRAETQAQIQAGHDEKVNDWFLWETEGKYIPENVR